MLDSLLSIIAPHLCCSCGRIGEVLCDNCIYYIIEDSESDCILCGAPVGIKGICTSCSDKTYFTRGWCVGERTKVLRKVIDSYKFEYVRAAHAPLAMLISQQIGILPSSIGIVPIPTIPSHIRQRGYDHVNLLAEKLSEYQNVTMYPVLERMSCEAQRGASRKQRFLQAASAFGVTAKLDGGTFLLIDDVITTGATLKFAAKALLEAGADEVWVAVVARQPVDDMETN